VHQWLGGQDRSPASSSPLREPAARSGLQAAFGDGDETALNAVGPGAGNPRPGQYALNCRKSGPARVVFTVLNRLTASGTVYVLQRRELENYLLDPDALAEFIGSLRPAQPPASAEIETLINETAESLRLKVVVNRVCRQFMPPQGLMNDDLRHRLANSATSQDDVIDALIERLMTPEGIREQITSLWAGSQADVARAKGAELLAIAPGEEILDRVFMHFLRRHYRKREDGAALAKAISPPSELEKLVKDFLAR
jgi:hypothetical protein